LHLSDLDVPSGEKDLDLSEFQMGAAHADLGQPTGNFPAYGDDKGGSGSGSGSDHDILLDDLSLPPGPLSNSSSTIIGMKSGGKQPSDSDVRLVPDSERSTSDSDVRMVPQGRGKPSDSDVTLVNEDVSIAGFNALSGSSDTERAVVGRDGHLDWITLGFGGKDGKVVSMNARGEDLRAELAKLLGEPAKKIEGAAEAKTEKPAKAS